MTENDTRPDDASVKAALDDARRLLAEGRPYRAEARLRTIVEQQPDNAPVVRLWCQTLLTGGDVRDAVPLLRKVIAAGTQDLLPRFCMAVAYHSDGDFESAHRQLDDLLSQQPDMVQAVHLKTRILVMQGREDEASRLFEQIDVDSHPLLAISFALFAPLVGRADEAISKLQQVVGRADLPPALAMDAGLMLGKLLDKAGRYEEAMSAAMRANGLVAATYRPENQEAVVEQLQTLFSAERVKTFAHATGDSSRPIFIVGMPRSGTSLVEAILNEHSQVAALGECTIIPGLRPLDLTNQAVVDAALVEILGAYCKLDAKHARITDKQLENHRALGALEALLPDARVIWCRRDPRDVAISCFFQSFQTLARWSHDLTHVMHYHQLYDRLMLHWTSVLDLPILEVSYERLVEDPRGQASRIIEHVGLEWEEACLGFAGANRVTLTQSNEQVKQEVYTSSVGRWKNYEATLASRGLVEPPGDED